MTQSDASNAGRPQGLSEREAEVYRLTVVNRLTQDKIAERLGISQPRVSQILADARAKLPPVDLAEIRAESMALHADIKRRAYELAEMNGAPVTAGKDGIVVFDPETNEPVRDYAGRVNALKLALLADAELRKLLGADAATKTEVSGSVHYVIEGADVEDLK